MQLLADKGFCVGLLSREEAVKLGLDVMSVGTVMLVLTAEESNDIIELMFVVGNDEAAMVEFALDIEVCVDIAKLEFELDDEEVDVGTKGLEVGKTGPV